MKNVLIGASRKVALVVCFGFFTSAQQARSQWVNEQQTDAYNSQEERFRVLNLSLSILEKANPMADLRINFRKGDLRFVAYKDVGLALPGVPDKQIINVLNSSSVKVLKGSTDVLTGNLSIRLHRVAQIYMQPYNKALLQYILSKRKANKKRTAKRAS
jgi:hypothetical protein